VSKSRSKASSKLSASTTHKVTYCKPDGKPYTFGYGSAEQAGEARKEAIKKGIIVSPVRPVVWVGGHWR